MQAYEYQAGCTDLDGLKRVSRDDPEPAAGEVLVRLRAASLNARDQAIVSGRYRLGTVARPTIALSDGAGEVTAVGAEVTRFAPGDRVAGAFVQGWIDGPFRADYRGSVLGVPLDGMLAEAVVLNQNGLVAIPEDMSFAEAATLPCAGVTAWHALFGKDPLMSGQTVLLIGAGGVSIMALQFAKMTGARAIIISSSDEKLERARALGADGGVNYITNPEWQGDVLELTDGHGADHVVEVGGGTLARSLGALAVGGRIHLIGFVSGREARFDAPAFVGAHATLDAIMVGSRAMFEAMIAAISQNGVTPVIDRGFSFDDVHDAFTYQGSKNLFGKVVITI